MNGKRIHPFVCTVCATLALLAACSASSLEKPASSAAVSSTTQNEEMRAASVADAGGFQAAENSAWGDLIRYFDPEGFAALSEETQKELDNTLLTEQSPQWTIKEDGKWFFE